MTRAQLLTRVRKICLGYAETDEGCPFGSPWFRVRGKMFCCLSAHDGTSCLVLKVGKENLELFLNDERFYKAPYLGRGGWVCLRLRTGTKEGPNWEEIEELLRESYNRIAPKRLRMEA